LFYRVDHNLLRCVLKMRRLRSPFGTAKVVQSIGVFLVHNIGFPVPHYRFRNLPRQFQTASNHVALFRAKIIIEATNEKRKGLADIRRTPLITFKTGAVFITITMNLYNCLSWRHATDIIIRAIIATPVNLHMIII